MASFKNKEIEKGLKKLNPEPYNNDHKYFEINIPGYSPILTKNSFSKKEYGDEYLKLIARDLFVSLHFVIELIRCTKYLEDYIIEISKKYKPGQLT